MRYLYKKNLFFSNGTRQMRVPRDFRSNFKEANQAHGCIVAQPCIAPAPGALKDCFDYTSSRSIGRYTFNRNSLRIVSCHRNSITDFFFTRVIFFRPKPINFPLQFFSYLKQRNPKKFSRNASSRISKNLTDSLRCIRDRSS